MDPPLDQPIDSEYWTTHICDCFSDVNSCCLVLWCPCVAFGRLSEFLDDGKTSCCYNGSLYLALCSVGAIMAAFGWTPLSCHWLYSSMYRGKIKSIIGMPENFSEECCIHFWCEPCALCQEYREMQNRFSDFPLGWKENQDGNETPVDAPIAPNMTRELP